MKLEDAVLKAKEVAKKSGKRYNLGAVLFDDKYFTVGFNRRFGVYCKNRNNVFSVHAEEMCIIKANRISNFNFKNSTLVVVRINKHNKFLPSLPCDSCQKLINQFNIPIVYYIV